MKFRVELEIEVGLAEYGDEYGVRGESEIRADLKSHLANVVGESLRVADLNATAQVTKITKRSAAVR